MKKSTVMEVGKSHLISVVGIDPALRNFGFVVALVDVDKNEIKGIVDMKLIKTEDERGKTVRRNSDDLRRAKEHIRAMQEICEGRAIAFAEIPVGSQSARAMASYGVCIGVLASCPIGLIEVTPSEVKKEATGYKTATKEEMIEWAHGKFPDAPWLIQKRNGQVHLKNENEHLADAIGAINAGLKTDQWKQLKNLLFI